MSDEIILPFRKPGAAPESREETSIELILTPQAHQELTHYQMTFQRAQETFNEAQQCAALALYGLQGSKNALDSRIGAIAKESMNDDAKALLAGLQSEPQIAWDAQGGKILITF